MCNPDLLYKLYSDTFTLHQENIRNRNKCFLELCIFISILFFYSYDSELTIAFVNAFINKYTNANISFQFYIIQSLIWVITLYLTMRYYQLNIAIERRYPQLDSLEKQLSENGNLDFGREGKDYAAEYPLFLNLIDFFYKWVFIAVYLTVIFIKIFSENPQQPSFIFDLIMSIGCISLTILYFWFLNKSTIVRCFKRR